MDYVEYIVIAFVMIIMLFAVIKATKKDAGLDFNKLVELLGGKIILFQQKQICLALK